MDVESFPCNQVLDAYPLAFCKKSVFDCSIHTADWKAERQRQYDESIEHNNRMWAKAFGWKTPRAYARRVLEGR